MLPNFESKEQLLDFLQKNLKGDKSRLVAMKKATFKKADAIDYFYDTPSKENATKDIGSAPMGEVTDKGNILVKAVINTTNIMDSHDDVHIPGIWKKSLSELKLIYHIQEHEMCFENVISDNVTAYTKNLKWTALGENYEGTTQALMFDSIVTPDRNPFMYDQYVKGYVRNHSVGMQYVKLLFCYNSKDKMWAEEKDNWDTYISQVVNRSRAEEKGYFWAVLEAKIIEGSAVLIGSNQVTPTSSVTEAKNQSESEAGATTSTTIEPPTGTQTKKPDFSKIKF